VSTLILSFSTAANCQAFCTWYARWLAEARLERTGDPRCVRVAFPSRFARTVMTVAQHNCALVEAA